MVAAEAERIVLVTTAEDGADAPASPARVFVALQRADVPVEELAVDEARPGSEPEGSEVARRAAREHAREAFFLDPLRRTSEVIGRLEGADAIRAVLTAATGSDAERPLAVTSLERFAQCPFKGYAHVILAAREGEAQRELPDAREEGNLSHSALAAAFLATRAEWARRPRDKGAILAGGLAAADAALAASAGHAPLRAVVRLRVRESVRAVLERAIEDEEWDFILAEQAFGRGRPWSPFRVDSAADAGELWLRGSIDRLDRSHVGARVRVIDYKRSKSTVRLASSQLGETALQVPIYAAVAARELASAASGAYVPIQPRDLAMESRARGSSEDRVAELARTEHGLGSEIERRAMALVTSARAGGLAPLPAREAECTYCDVSGGCRKPRFAMAPDDVEEKEAP
jgi:RecB family exonuclease